MTETISRTCDVLVIGGGPAGSSVAGLLAKRGYDVTLLERERFPRYHIGESLITGCLTVIDELGLRERLEGLGFVQKYGGTLVWGGKADRWAFEFIEGGPYTHSYQVRRADYDALLLARARELGVTVHEETAVSEVCVDDDGRVTGAYFETRRGGPRVRVDARLTVDASGQARVLGKQVTGVTRHDDMKNVAGWTYYQNAARLEGKEAGNILIENVTGGWFWGIPLHDGTMSVGYVTPTEDASAAGGDLPSLFESKLEETTELRRLLADATPAAGFRSARDWSYTSERFHGPGWVLLGDAAAFIDPLFSTGVALASIAAGALTKAIDQAMRDPERAEETLDRYENGYQKFLTEILDFVRFFYDSKKNREAYYEKAQELVDPKKSNAPRTDFVTLISGLSAATPIFDESLEPVDH